MIDFILHEFYREQFEIIRYLEMLQAMAGIGCSTWELYSEWKKTFSDLESQYHGGFHCVYDKDPSELNALNKAARTYFYSNRADQQNKGAENISCGVSGDVEPSCVAKSTMNNSLKVDWSTCNQSTIEGFRQAAEVVVKPRFINYGRLAK